MRDPHVFAGNPLDRGDTDRRDEEWLARAAKDPQSRVLPMWQLNVLVKDNPHLSLAWVSPADLQPLDIDVAPVFLGLSAGVPHFALDVSEVHDPAHELNLDGTWHFEEARSAATRLPAAESGILAQSRSQLDWHARHGFCSVCGTRTTVGRGGLMRKCGACGAEHFPRTDPVVIMVVQDKHTDRCLLGQSRGRLSRSGMFSALAGFMDQGEAIEEAVRREVGEEAGVEVGEVRYHSSQPWPFPSSLMIGCHANAVTTEIRRDNEEMADVRWFSRAEVTSALNEQNPDLRVPGPIAIAHHLIKAWAEGEVREYL
jgi:NAD+ diphosphatase